MPQYTVTDPKSGRSVTLTGDSPPTAAELEEVFAKVNAGPATEEQPSALRRFVGAVASTLDPRPILSVASDLGAAINPGDPVAGLAARDRLAALGKGLIGAQVGEGKKAVDDYHAGRYSEMAGHAGAAALPLLGPAAAHAGERIGSGDVAGGLGEAAGLLLPSVGKYGVEARAVGSFVPTAEKVAAAQKALALAKASRGARALDALSDEQRATIAWAEQNGIPVDAATATGNKAVKAIQHVADRTIGGSMVANTADRAQAGRLATVGEQLAAKAHGAPVSPVEAGGDLGDAVQAAMRGKATEADAAYDTFRNIAEQHTVDVPDLPRPGTAEAAKGTPSEQFSAFAPAGSSPDKIFDAALADARAHGFEGHASDLRKVFDERVESAQGLKAETEAPLDEVGPAALLRDIRKLGGIRPFEKTVQNGKVVNLRGDWESLVESFGAKSGWGQRGGSSIFRTGSDLEADGIVDRLRQDPKWRGIIEDTNDLKAALEDIAHQGPDAGGPRSRDLEHYLAGAGVHPGSEWWKDVPVRTQSMAAPVDMAGPRAAFKPMYEELARQARITPGAIMGDKAVALQALDKLMHGPDAVPAATADQLLSDLKRFARSDVPELRTAGQGVAAGAIKHLEASLQRTVSAMGPEAEQALGAGRQATIAKVQLGDLYKRISDEPVLAFEKGTRAGDRSLGWLQEADKAAPGEVAKVGRAWLDSLFDKANTADGRFEHRAAVAGAWEKLGADTKRILFKDPGLRSDLDRFFKFVRMSADNPNPSGTGHTLISMGQIGHVAASPITGIAEVLGTAGISKLLHSRAGVQLLTKGIRIPMQNKAALSSWMASAGALLNADPAVNTPNGSPQLAAAGR